MASAQPTAKTIESRSLGSIGNGEAALSTPSSNPEIPSFELVYERYFDFVWSMARRFGATQEMTDDVVQDVFMVVHAKLHTLQRPESLRSWLYGIVRRTASDHRRRRRSELPPEDASNPAVLEDLSARSPADLAEQNAQVRRLWTLLDQIDPIKREVFILVELEEFTCPEVAEALEIPLNTAYSRLRSAREAFEAALARDTARRRGPQ